jgi:hypothetical protein
MATETQNQNLEYPLTLQELLDDKSGRYAHLQVFMHRYDLTPGYGEQYLLVKNNGFWVYRLDDITYNNGVITIVLTNAQTGNQGELCLGVNDRHPQLYLVSWNDIREMVRAQDACHVSNDDLQGLENLNL